MQLLCITVPVAHKEIAYEGEQQQENCEVQLELLVLIFVSKSDNKETYGT